MRRHLPPASTLPKDLPVDRHTIDILTEGVSRGDPHFDSLEFMLSPASDELPAIWRAHRPALLKEAERRGIGDRSGVPQPARRSIVRVASDDPTRGDVPHVAVSDGHVIPRATVSLWRSDVDGIVRRAAATRFCDSAASVPGKQPPSPLHR